MDDEIKQAVAYLNSLTGREAYGTAEEELRYRTVPDKRARKAAALIERLERERDHYFTTTGETRDAYNRAEEARIAAVAENARLLADIAHRQQAWETAVCAVTAQNARLREALQRVVALREAHGYTSVNRRADDMAAVARAAIDAAKKAE